MLCDACYESQIQSCENIVIKAGLQHDTPVFWIIQKASSFNLIQRLTNTNTEGDLTIPLADLPKGFLVKGNYYKIRARQGADYRQPVDFIFNTKTYSCIIAEMVNIDRLESDTSEVNVIK